MPVVSDRLEAFLANLECLDSAGQRDAFVTEVIETGGTYVPPRDDSDASHLFEISLHGIVACGASEEEALTHWRRMARKAIGPAEIEDDGFITVVPALHTRRARFATSR